MQFADGKQLLQQAIFFMEGKDADGKPHEKNFDKAEAILNKILTNNVGNPIVLYALGSMHLGKGHFGLAIQLLSQVTGAMPKFGEAWNNLALAWKSVPDFNKAEAALKNAAKHINRDVVNDIYCNLAAINVTRNRPEQVLYWADMALAAEPDHRKAQWHKGLALLEMRKWDEAWPYHDARLTGGAPGEIAERNYHGEEKTPLWDGATVGVNDGSGWHRARVVIHGEQGMGDEIMFASCIPDAIATGCEIVFEPSPRMEAAFKRAFPTVKVFGTDETDGRRWIDELGQPDFKVALGSLPRFFRKSAEAFPGKPYLAPDKDKRAWWGDKLRQLGSRPNIGLAWQGGVEQTRYDARSFHPSMYAPLFQATDANWISLQYDPTAKQCVEEVFRDLGVKIHHWPKAVEQRDQDTGKQSDLDELIALVSKLDLVITVCQTVVHVAGALGVPCFCLTPSEPSWRYSAGDATDMIWYRSVKQFRQAKESKEWAPVIDAVAEGLSHFVAQRKFG